MPCRSFNCGIVAAPFPFISFIISDGVACLTCRCPPRFAVSSPAWSSFRPSVRRHLIAVSFRSPFRLAMLLAWLGGSVSLSSLSLVISGNLLACCPTSRPASRFSPRFPARLASRRSSRCSSRSPLGDVIAALPNRSPCRSACGHQSPRHACRGTGSRTGRGAYLAIDCPPCRRCLLWDGVGLCLFRLRRPA